MNRPLFFTGWHQPAHAHLFDRSMYSINRLEHRKSDFHPNDWILDSGAFTRLTTGRGHMPVTSYALQIARWSKCGNLLATVAQDFMCEPFVLEITGGTVQSHQRETIRRYDQLRNINTSGVYIMPVIQGYDPREYVEHVEMYGDRLAPDAWVGVGSVCKRNASPWRVHAVLESIKAVRPDLRLHGFGLKRTALLLQSVSEMLYSSDSMAASFMGRYHGQGANDPNVAINYANQIAGQPLQGVMV